jgi:hypothetical protein
MNRTRDIHPTEPHEDGMTPGDAARLLAHTQSQAQRELDFRSPLLTLVAAAVVLLGFGAVWLSVRDQHPFTGPTAASLVVLYVLVAIRIGTVLYAHRHASAGVTGRSVRLRRAEAAAATVALVAVYVLMAALIADGIRTDSFYWIYGVTATMIALGTFWAARSAAQEDWTSLGLSVAITLVAAGSALAGPRGMWLGDAVGCCVVLLAYSAWQVRVLHASRSTA